MKEDSIREIVIHKSKIDQEELWTTVGRKGKRFARSDEIDDLIRILKENIELSITCAEKLPKQF